MICRFACVKYELINGSVISLKNTNIAYIKPHISKVNGNDYLLFDEFDDIFINGYDKRPAYQEMMKDARNKNINVIVAFKLDRLTRSVYDIEKLISKNVILIVWRMNLILLLQMVEWL